MIIKREDLKVAGRIVSTSTEGVVCDSSQVFSEDYVNKYGRQPQFSTDGFQSTINDKLIELYKSIQKDISLNMQNQLECNQFIIVIKYALLIRGKNYE